MFENLKSNKQMYETVMEALDALNMVSEPHKGKLLAGFKALDSLGKLMRGYKDADAMMDDAASALTAMTGIDVRKQGICPALALAIRKGTPSQISDAIANAIKWHVADYLKLKAENE